MQDTLQGLVDTWHDAYHREMVCNIDYLGRPLTLRLSYTGWSEEDQSLSQAYHLSAWFYDGHNHQQEDNLAARVDSRSRIDTSTHTKTDTEGDLTIVFRQLPAELPLEEMYATNYEGQLQSH